MSESDVVQEMLQDMTDIPEWLREELKKRREFGIKKYGKGVDEKDGHDWLSEGMDELLDCIVYLAAHTKLVGEGPHILAYFHALQALNIIHDEMQPKIITE